MVVWPSSPGRRLSARVWVAFVPDITKPNRSRAIDVYRIFNMNTRDRSVSAFRPFESEQRSDELNFRYTRTDGNQLDSSSIEVRELVDSSRESTDFFY